MALTYPEQVIGSEITATSEQTKLKINELVVLFSQLVIAAHT